MAIFDWIAHRTEAIGWDGWKDLARAASVSLEKLSELEVVDDLEMLSRSELRRLAKALHVGVRDLEMIDAGDIDDVPEGYATDRDGPWPVFDVTDDDMPAIEQPPELVACLGRIRDDGTVSLDEDANQWSGPFIPVECKDRRRFSLRREGENFWTIFKQCSTENLRGGRDAAVYVCDEFGQGAAYFGRVECGGPVILMRLGTNRLERIDADTVRRAGRVMDWYPAPLRGGSLVAVAEPEDLIARAGSACEQPAEATSPVPKRDYFEWWASLTVGKGPHRKRKDADDDGNDEDDQPILSWT